MVKPVSQVPLVKLGLQASQGAPVLMEALGTLGHRDHVVNRARRGKPGHRELLVHLDLKDPQVCEHLKSVSFSASF